MAITRVPKGFVFIGLSTDTKPTENITIFSEFHCTDNGDIFIYHYTDANDGTKEWKILLT